MVSSRTALLTALGADNAGSGLFLPVALLYVTRDVGLPLAVASPQSPPPLRPVGQISPDSPANRSLICGTGWPVGAPGPQCAVPAGVRLAAHAGAAAARRVVVPSLSATQSAVR